MNSDRIVFIVLAMLLFILCGILAITIHEVKPQPEKFNPSLPPATISVYIGSRPSGAMVRIDGTPQQYMTPAYYSITPEQHTYRILLPGYRDYVSSFTLNQSTSQRVTFYMKPARVAGVPSQETAIMPEITSASPIPFTEDQEQCAECYRTCGREYDLQIRECSARYNLTNLSWVYDYTIPLPLRGQSMECFIGADMNQSDCSTTCYDQW